jgi:phosphohistidine phosphatase
LVVMKTLMLMRHAKSSWAEPGIDDHERMLNARGRAASPMMARWLEAKALRPDRVLCSSASRTVETAALMRGAVPSLPEPKTSDRLYHAGSGTIMEHVRRMPGECTCLLLIGHEPGLGSLLQSLSRHAVPALRHADRHFPTAAIAVLEADVEDWTVIGVENVRFVAFKAPRDLIKRQAPGV